MSLNYSPLLDRACSCTWRAWTNRVRGKIFDGYCVRANTSALHHFRSLSSAKVVAGEKGCGGGGWWAEGALLTGWATFYQKSSGLTELSHVQAVQWQSLYFMSCNKYTKMFRQDFIKCKTGTCVAKCHCRGCQLWFNVLEC